MYNISAREAQNNFGNLITKAIKEPVVINKYGKPSVVVMSYEDYENFTKFEDLYWEMKAEQAGKKGFLTKVESAEFLNEIIKG
jgi:antitoxin Phd